ncbi:hypothetical protein V496_01633 [Pseudogymnoascus sp. VKM F-4515 (FW-2607)]|nr:hypothetical protein V496_01633 [Pseudogymnoascus sp. VKM F-4515 (FW-2607)]
MSRGRGGLRLPRLAPCPDGNYTNDDTLHVCIRDDDIPKLQQLLRASPAPDINLAHYDSELGLPLHFAAWCGNLDAVDLLLAAGADASITGFTEWGYTAIAAAADRGHRDIVKRLWTCCPPERYLQVARSQICLLVAAQHGHASIVEDMLEWWNGWPQDVMIMALRVAAQEWHFGVVNLLLKRESFEQPTLQNALHDAAGLKPLPFFQLFAKYEGVDYANQQLLIALLIDAGANPSSFAYDTTPLVLTVASNSILTCALKTLLDKGADPNMTDGSGQSALHILTAPVPTGQVSGGSQLLNETAIHLLLQYKASVSQPDSAGECPIHWAAYGFDLRLFHTYLSSQPGPDRDALLRLTNNNGETLLHYAAAGCGIEVIEYLLSQGLDVNATNSNGWTPLMCALTPINSNAVEEISPKTVSEATRSAYYLLSRGADPSTVTNEGWTPLHALALYLDVAGKAEGFAKDLISRGADPEARAPLLGTIGPYVSWGMPWGYRLRDMMANPSAWEMAIRHDMTPLHWAAERGAVGVIKALLAKGVDVSSMDVDGALPARMAVESKIMKTQASAANNIINLLVGAGLGISDMLAHSP